VDAARADRLTGDRLTEELRAAGLRATRPRLAVLGFLREHRGRHHSAEEVTASLAATGGALLRGSVYNVLGSLASAGLVLVADTGPGRALYEAPDGWHHHFVCRVCGRVVDVPCIVGAKPCLDAGLAGAEVDEAQIIFRGRCPACTSTANRASA
jgi:Fe2+ or Zn2+ uptake regulation protein